MTDETSRFARSSRVSNDQGEPTLDPADWPSVRQQGHRMLDDMFDHIERVRSGPLWQQMPIQTRAVFRASLPHAGLPLGAVHQEFKEHILPYALGNLHPGFMGWVHGGGTVTGMLAEMLAGGLNANLGGRDHAPVEVERQIVAWMKEIFSFPEGSTGLFVTGTSIANLIGVLVARTAVLGSHVRQRGIGAEGRRLTAYTSAAAHGSIAQAMDLSGIGTDALRVIPTDRWHRMDLRALRNAITVDRTAGRTPFLVIGTAGTVDIGACDDLHGIADLCEEEKLRFHVDGAFGALAILAPDVAPQLDGIQRADSLAFDFHKWAQVPYDAGFILVRDGVLHHSTFASTAAYLRQEARGLAAGSPWFCDFGPDLSRGFRALKTWFTLKVHGTDALGEVISHSCALARYLGQRVASDPRLELLAPVQLNIVCFGYRCDDPDRTNAKIVVGLHEAGLAAPSLTVVEGRRAIRAAIVNHRTNQRDVDRLIAATLAIGEAESRGADARAAVAGSVT